MPFAIPPFAKVLALFFVQGLMLWVMTFDGDGLLFLLPCWVTAIGALVAWCAIWLILHPGRGWRPWLECLLLAGAGYWLPAWSDRLLRRAPEYPPRVFAVSLETVLMFLSSAVVLALPLVVILWPLRWITNWRMQAPTNVNATSLRTLFLLIFVLALHLVTLLPILPPIPEQPMNIIWDTWHHLAMLMQVALIVLGFACVGLGTHLARPGFVLIVFGSVTLTLLFWQTLHIANLFDLTFGIICTIGTTYLQAAATVFTLREIGYRLVSMPRTFNAGVS